jgi:hypothetical protein
VRGGDPSGRARAVRALLSAPPDSIAGPRALREVTTWLAAEHGAAAMIDLAEELAADLAEAFDAVAAAEGRAEQCLKPVDDQGGVVPSRSS